MITIEVSQSGHSVLAKDGRLLGSRQNPIREAQLWLDSVAIQIRPGDAVVIFGLGSGYHVQKFIEKYPYHIVYVIENDPDVGSLCPVLSDIEKQVLLITETDWEKLSWNPRFQALATQPFSILKHPASYQMSIDYFRNAEGLLLARRQRDFLHQLRFRQDLLQLIELARLEEAPTDSLLSIKNLDSIWKETDIQTREKKLWMILRELVK